MKQLINLVVFSTIIFFALSCSTATGSNNSPSDHSVKKGGVMHKKGLNDPTTNCIGCHSTDLIGGTSGKSCYSCHNKKW